jgi:hypothetical protein
MMNEKIGMLNIKAVVDYFKIQCLIFFRLTDGK